MFLPRITPEDIESTERLAAIQAAPDTYYWTSNWSPEFYVGLAKLGFMNITTEAPVWTGTDSNQLRLMEVLAPEMQSAYAVLDFENLHLSRSTQRWIRSETCDRLGLRLQIPVSVDTVVSGIARSYGEINWVTANYIELLHKIESEGPWGDFELMPVGLTDNEGNVVAGELGYRLGRIYTSLTGFFDRKDPKFSNSGKLQLFLLGKWLAAHGYAFWNLGHPYMQYKLDLGARIVQRADFLRRWNSASRLSLPEG
ncbi:MAG: Leu/Phe-tRNA-protein transferase [Verrucomicrobiales bacterium]|jgi:Leu/Phe-tRNA-protein transferase